jgi:hypothetical protein
MREFFLYTWFCLSGILWPHIKEQLAKHPAISISAAIGPSVVGFFVAINPMLQFLGLAFGLFLAFLTAEAKLEERKERRARKIDPQLIEDLKNKEENANRLSGKHK